MNDAAAERAEEAVLHIYGFSEGYGLLMANAQDLMSDLMHLIERECGKGDITGFISCARRNYEAERYGMKEA